MKLYRFSPIQNKEELMRAIEHVHFSAHSLCKKTFGTYLPNTGNLAIFCHYPEEYEYLTEVRKEITDKSDAFNGKYFKLNTPITFPEKEGVPETTYTNLYIRQPDPYRHHVGDIDFYLNEKDYIILKGTLPSGARVFTTNALDMIELYNPDNDVLAYIGSYKITDISREY